MTVRGPGAPKNKPWRNVSAVVRQLGDSVWIDAPHWDLPASTGHASGKITWGSDLPVRYAIRIWGDSVPVGTLAPGGAADLVVWDGDPLEPGSAPVAIFLKGSEISLRTRQTLLRDRYRPGSEQRQAAPASR